MRFPIIRSFLVGLCVGLASGALASGAAAQPNEPVRDMRAAIAAESRRLKAELPAHLVSAPRRPPIHAGESRRSRPSVRRSGNVRPRTKMVGSGAGWPVPGGVGYGYWFNDDALHWENSTVLDFFVLTPTTIGGISDTLYLTSTNRSNLGAEAHIGYWLPNQQAFFRVYDWARPEGDRWQALLWLPLGHPEYVTDRPDEFGAVRQMCRIRNGTIYLGMSGSDYLWRNEALLFNFDLGLWDLVYSYDYTTAAKEDNTFQYGEHMGSWGPIVEVFGEESAYQDLEKIGFDLIRLFQDGNPASLWLTPSNSHKSQMAWWQLISRTENRGFVVYTGATDPDGDRYDNAQEAEAGTDPGLASSFFDVDAMARYPGPNEVGVTVGSVLGRLYQLQAAPTVGGPWSDDGAPLQGTGAGLELRSSTGYAKRFYQVGVEYDMGTLCVTTNIMDATCTLSPPGGTIPPWWSQTPNGDRWDKCTVGVPAGTYLLSFDPVEFMTTPADQWVTITRGTVTHAEGIYEAE